MKDTISRQAAIDALDKHCDVVCQYSKKQRSVMCGACPLGTAFDVIDGLPSAQFDKGINVPDKNVGKIGDLIDRQAAIDAVECIVDHHSITPYQTMRAAIDHAKRIISGLPSAQPEQLLLQKFTEYQIEWLTSHCDIELEPVLEGWIVRFLRDTAECYESERREDG